MGMAASQARLLSITARMHDVEFQTQHIQSQKLALATQRDDVYQEYMDALDAKKIQVKLGAGTNAKMVDATYANVCGYQEGRDGTFAMIDASSGLMIVEPEVEEAFNVYGNDKYSFAWAMMGFENGDFGWCYDNDGLSTGSEGGDVGGQNVGIVTKDEPLAANADNYLSFIDSNGNNYFVSIMTDVEKYVFDTHKDDSNFSGIVSKYNKIKEMSEEGSKTPSDKKEIQKAVDDFRDALYGNTQCSNEIYNMMRLEKPDDEEKGTPKETINNDNYKKGFDSNFDKNQFDYYVRLFEGIEECGGCMTIDDFAKDGDTGNEWFNNIIKSGKAVLMEYNTTGTKRGWNEISIATTTKLDEVNDDTNEKKAEAKYEHELSIINRKDTKFDQDLNKLETERTALKTEYDAIKQVKDDNIERTFKIFS